MRSPDQRLLSLGHHHMEMDGAAFLCHRSSRSRLRQTWGGSFTFAQSLFPFPGLGGDRRIEYPGEPQGLLVGKILFSLLFHNGLSICRPGQGLSFRTVRGSVFLCLLLDRFQLLYNRGASLLHHAPAQVHGLRDCHGRFRGSCSGLFGFRFILQFFRARGQQVIDLPTEEK